MTVVREHGRVCRTHKHLYSARANYAPLGRTSTPHDDRALLRVTTFFRWNIPRVLFSSSSSAIRRHILFEYIFARKICEREALAHAKHDRPLLSHCRVCVCGRALVTHLGLHRLPHQHKLDHTEWRYLTNVC